MRNMIGSRANRAIVNTDMVRGKAAGKAVANVSNSFSLGVSSGNALIISFMNCGARRIRIGKRGRLRMILSRSTRVLSRIIIVKCNAVGGDSLAKTISSVNGGSVGSSPMSGLKRTVRKGVSNIRVMSTNGPKSGMSVGVHNLNSVGGYSPLIIVSKIPASLNLSSLGVTSIRHLSMLGSTSTATVCNSQKTGKIIVVAAGHNARKGKGLTMSTGCSFRGTAGMPSLLGTTRCTRLDGSVVIGDKHGPGPR